MKQYEFNTIQNEGYSGIVTILDYEISFSKTLKNTKLLKEIEGKLQSSACKDTRLIFDLALLYGVNEYRFVEIRWIGDHFLIKSKKYATPNDKVAKAGSEVEVGDVVHIEFGSGSIDLKITKIAESVRKEDAASMYEIINK